MKRWGLPPLFAALLLSRPAVCSPAPGGEESTGITLAAEESAADARYPFLTPPVVFFLQGDGDVARWQIQLFDFDERKADYIQGLGRPPYGAIAWRGITREGELLRNGFYTARFVWTDHRGRANKSQDVKVSLLTPPGLREFLGPKVHLLPGEGGMIVRIEEDLTFAPDGYDLRPQCLATLEKVSNFLRAYPQNRLAVLGHADSSGRADWNRALSRKRAETIYRFLVEHGVEPERMTYAGMGAERPIASNATAAGRMKNRRVEIVFKSAI